MMTTSEDVSTSSWCVMTPSLCSVAQHSVTSYTRSRSRDLGKWSGASDVINDIIQLSTKAVDNREFLPATRTANTGRNDVTRHHYHRHQQQQQQQTTGQNSAAVKRRTESSTSSSWSSSSSLSFDVARKRPRYEYNEVQRRLLSDAFAKKKTPSSSELDDLTEQLRSVDSADRRLGKSNVRIWFQNRRREQRQLASSSSSPSSSSSAPAAASKLATDVSKGCHWPVSSLGRLHWPTTRDNVLEAVTRLARYCITPADVAADTCFNYTT